MAFTFKKITAPLVLMSFLIMALFSFAGMSYGPDGSMQGDCPFSNLGMSLCPPSALPGAVHHISAYQSFINVPINSGITALIISLLIAVALIPFAKPFFQLEKLTELAARLLAYHKANLVKVFDPLLIAFSDGILNPKIY